MVKILLEEQRALKDKLEKQEQKMRTDTNSSGVSGNKDMDPGLLMRKQREITKKASERTRSQNP